MMILTRRMGEALMIETEDEGDFLPVFAVV
jgi:hypothetical protein